ncbi:MAG: hypothetical protein ACTHKG_15865 [Nocardioides sp.]
MEKLISTDRSICGLTVPRSRTFPDSVESPARARQFVMESMCPEHGALALAAAQLVASEMVTRAVLQGGAPVSLTVTCRLDEIRLEVAEHGQATRTAGDAFEALRSELLHKVANRNGTVEVGTGRVHWCEVPTGYLPVHADTF